MRPGGCSGRGPWLGQGGWRGHRRVRRVWIVSLVHGRGRSSANTRASSRGIPHTGEGKRTPTATSRIEQREQKRAWCVPAHSGARETWHSVGEAKTTSEAPNGARRKRGQRVRGELGRALGRCVGSGGGNASTGPLKEQHKERHRQCEAHKDFLWMRRL